MKRNFVIEDQEIYVFQERSPVHGFRLDTHGSTREEMKANAEIAEVESDGTEVGCYSFDEADEAVQTKVLKMIHKEMHREQDA